MCMQVLIVGGLWVDADFLGFVFAYLEQWNLCGALDLAGNVCSCCVKAGLLVFLQLGAITVNVNCTLVEIFVSVFLHCLLFIWFNSEIMF